MKQSELNRELNLVAKSEARQKGWKCVSGMPYWSIGPLFFTLGPIANSKQGTFGCSLRFKWLDLDYALWKVLDLESNRNEPFSLHANGAFVLTGREIHEIATEGLEWAPEVVAQQIAEAIRQADERSREVAAQVTSLQSYLEFIQHQHELFLQRYPGAVTDLWMETFLVAMVGGDMPTATEIARARVAASDSGGFRIGIKSFFDLALAFCEKELNRSIR